MDNCKSLRIISSQNLEPRQFLRYCFDLDTLNPQAILEEEISFSYRGQCIKLLSKILGINRKTIRDWGDDPNFGRMPQYARNTCYYAQLALSKKQLYRVLHYEYTPPTANPSEYIEEILLSGLPTSEKIKTMTSTKFRSQYFTSLSKVIGVAKHTIYEWGDSLELSKMPKRYKNTLGYALAAYRKHKNISEQSAA